MTIDQRSVALRTPARVAWASQRHLHDGRWYFILRCYWLARIQRVKSKRCPVARGKLQVNDSADVVEVPALQWRNGTYDAQLLGCSQVAPASAVWGLAVFSASRVRDEAAVSSWTVEGAHAADAGTKAAAVAATPAPPIRVPPPPQLLLPLSDAVSGPTGIARPRPLAPVVPRLAVTRIVHDRASNLPL